MPTLSCLEAPPCTLVLLTVCRRKSLLLLHPRSRSLLHQRGSTLSGSEDPFSPLSPPSSRCGSPSKSTMSLVPVLSQEVLLDLEVWNPDWMCAFIYAFLYQT